jgi:hypothetical protein
VRRAWSPAAEDKLRRLYATTDLTRLAFLLKRTEKAIRSRAKVLGLTKGERRPWAAAEDRKLGRLYATRSAAECAEVLGRTVSSVQQRVNLLGLHKPLEWVAGRARQRWAEGRHENSRKALAGGRGWNKGVKGSTGLHPNCRTTQFKAGRPAAEARNYRPIGSLRITRDGALERKVTDDPNVYPARRWVPVTRLVWEQHNGPIPEGHAVAFKEGRKTTDPDRITVDALELVSRAELARRNAPWKRYPKEVTDLIRLKGRVTRQINKRSKQA